MPRAPTAAPGLSRSSLVAPIPGFQPRLAQGTLRQKRTTPPPRPIQEMARQETTPPQRKSARPLHHRRPPTAPPAPPPPSPQRFFSAFLTRYSITISTGPGAWLEGRDGARFLSVEENEEKDGDISAQTSSTKIHSRCCGKIKDEDTRTTFTHRIEQQQIFSKALYRERNSA